MPQEDSAWELIFISLGIDARSVGCEELVLNSTEVSQENNLAILRIFNIQCNRALDVYIEKIRD